MPNSISKYAHWLVIATLLASSPAAGAGNFVLLCNKANPVTSLSKSDLKKVFTGGMKQWASGAVVQVGLITSDAPETLELGSLIGMTPRELMQRIQEQVFKGEMKRPVVLRSSADCAAFARSSPGAVCVASAQLASPETRVIPIQ